MLSRSWKVSALRRSLGRESLIKNDEYVFFCPRHSHHKAKLCVNLKTDKFHCWVCGYKGNDISRLLGQDDRHQYDKKNESETIEKVIEYDVPILPNEFTSLANNNRSPYANVALSYLFDRGLLMPDILRYKLGYCEDGEYKHRIIIPSFDRFGELNFFVGRKYFDNIGLSYKHGNFDKNIIFNEYLIDWSRPIILTEGPFDAMIAGENAIPLQGNRLSKDSLLFSKILENRSTVFVSLDSDVKNMQFAIVDMLMRYGINVYSIDVSSYGVKDVGEMTKDQFIIAMSNAHRVNSDIDMIRARIRI